LAFCKTVQIIQPEEANSDAAFWSKSLDFGADDLKMLLPGLPSRMKQRNQLTRERVDGANVGPFVAITAQTRQSKIGLVRCATMLNWDDVIGFVPM
jgi:hypothetical protein